MSRSSIDEAVNWVRSRRCTSGQCVEISRTPDRLRIRDSKQNLLGHTQPIIALTLDKWCEFTDALLANQVGHLPHIGLQREEDGAITLSSEANSLHFDAEEWIAFVGGLADGEFD